MSVLQSWRRRGKSPRRPLPILGSLLLALAISPAAHAVTTVSIDGHSAPVTLTVGDTVTVRYDVAKPGGTVQFSQARDSLRSGKYDPAYPVFSSSAFTEGGGGDVDPAPGKAALAFTVIPGMP